MIRLDSADSSKTYCILQFLVEQDYQVLMATKSTYLQVGLIFFAHSNGTLSHNLEKVLLLPL